MTTQDIINDMRHRAWVLRESSKKQNGELAMNEQAVASRSLAYIIETWAAQLQLIDKA